jgi:hypothetical protein
MDQQVFGALRSLEVNQRPAPDGAALLTKTESGTWRFRRFEMTSTALVMPNDLSVDEWQEAGDFMAGLSGALAWWVADWMLRAEQVWKYAHEAVAERFGLDVATLYVYTWCARQFAPEQRVAGASFSHHRVVAKLNHDERAYWLEKAAANGWTLSEFRARLAAGKQRDEQQGWRHDRLFDKDYAPKVSRMEMRKLALAASAGDQKAQQRLIERLESARRWLDDVERVAYGDFENLDLNQEIQKRGTKGNDHAR